MPTFSKNKGFNMKSKGNFDFGSKNQGLSKAKKKARKIAAKQISKSSGGLMAKGKKMTQAQTEITKYTDY